MLLRPLGQHAVAGGGGADHQADHSEGGEPDRAARRRDVGGGQMGTQKVGDDVEGTGERACEQPPYRTGAEREQGRSG